MPLPDERPRGSVANLIGKFEQQSKRASIAANSVPPLPASHAVPRKSTLNLGVGSEVLNGAAKERSGKIESKTDEGEATTRESEPQAKDTDPTTVIESGNDAAPVQTTEEPGSIYQPEQGSASASSDVAVPSGDSASSPPRKATMPGPASKLRAPAAVSTPKTTPSARSKPPPASTSTASLSKSRPGRPDSRTSTTSSPAPRAASTTPRTIPLPTNLSAPTASSLAKARSPPTVAAASPRARRLSSTKEASTLSPSTKAAAPTANVTPAKTSIPVRAKTPAGRGTPKARVGLAGAGMKRPTPAATMASQVSPTVHVPEGVPRPGGDPETSTAVAQRELELLTAQVPPIVTEVERGELVGEPGHPVEADIAEEVVEEREEDESHPEVAEMEAFDTSAAEGAEDHEEDIATLHPEQVTLPTGDAQADFDEVRAQLAKDLSQDEAPPPKEVLESVPLDGVAEVDATEGILKLEPHMQEHDPQREDEDEDEGVAVIPDEE